MPHAPDFISSMYMQELQDNSEVMLHIFTWLICYTQIIMTFYTAKTFTLSEDTLCEELN